MMGEARREQRVRAGTEVCKLVIDRTLKLRVPVPERFGPEVRVGQAVAVTTAASPRPAAGTVARINPAVEPAPRTFEVEVQVPNPAGDIKPGGFARAAILTRVDPEAVTVPVTAPYSFAGGVLGYLESDDSPPPGRLRRGMAFGTVVASLTVEDFGLARLQRTNRQEIDARLEQYRAMLSF